MRSSAICTQATCASVGRDTQGNFDGPIQTIIPWASNLYTETLIENVRAAFGDSFWGFWMLGGMSGGGMGFIFDPARKTEAQDRLNTIMREACGRLAGGVAFAMKPVVYDFTINERGTYAELKQGSAAVLPDGYYNIVLPALLRKDQRLMTAGERTDLERFSQRCHDVAGARERAADCSTGCCLTEMAANTPGRHLTRCLSRTVSIPSSTSASSLSCAPVKSGSHKTGSRRQCRSKTWRRTRSSMRAGKLMRVIGVWERMRWLPARSRWSR